jgi:hypothetical protein
MLLAGSPGWVMTRAEAKTPGGGEAWEEPQWIDTVDTVIKRGGGQVPEIFTIGPTPMSTRIPSQRPEPLSFNPREATTAIRGCSSLAGQPDAQVWMGINPGEMSCVTVDSSGNAVMGTWVEQQRTGLPGMTASVGSEVARHGGDGSSLRSVSLAMGWQQFDSSIGGDCGAFITGLVLHVNVPCYEPGVQLMCVLASSGTLAGGQKQLTQLGVMLEGELDSLNPFFPYQIWPASDLILPSGMPMPTMRAPYNACHSELGPRPDPGAVVNNGGTPCDEAFARALMCQYDIDCSRVRAAASARTQAVGGSAIAVAGVAGGALGFCASTTGSKINPPVWIAITTGVIAIGAALGGVLLVLDGVVEKLEDARARDAAACWDGMVFGIVITSYLEAYGYWTFPECE